MRLAVEAHQAACLQKVVSAIQDVRTNGVGLTVIAQALSRRADLGIVANVSALVTSTT